MKQYLFFSKFPGSHFIILLFVVLSSIGACVVCADDISSDGGSLSLTPGELEWISTHPVIRICPDPYYPPFEMLTSDGGYQGISADLLRIIAERAGLTLEVVPCENWSQCIEKIRNREVDILGAVFISDLRSQYLFYTDPFYSSPLEIITRVRVPAMADGEGQAFVKLGRFITDDLPGVRADTRDPALVETFIGWLGERDVKKPFFAFLFFDAPHGPYIYPDEFDRYKPSNRSPNYVTTGKKEALPLYNSYRNAVCFDDHLVGKVLGEVKKRGLLEDTVILITGDHGEEFYESGFWGHTSAFSKYQSRVSYVLLALIHI